MGFEGFGLEIPKEEAEVIVWHDCGVVWMMAAARGRFSTAE